MSACLCVIRCLHGRRRSGSRTDFFAFCILLLLFLSLLFFVFFLMVEYLC